MTGKGQRTGTNDGRDEQTGGREREIRAQDAIPTGKRQKIGRERPKHTPTPHEKKRLSFYNPWLRTAI